MLYNYIIIFLYQSCFVNYSLSFNFGWLRTIRLLVQVHKHWVQFTIARRGYNNHICHNKPQIGNRSGVWMTSCPKAMGWEFGDFSKRRQLGLDCGPVELVVYWGLVQLVVEWRPVESGHVVSWSWVKTMMLRSWSLTMEFCRSQPTEILNTTGCAARLWGPTRHLELC